MVRHRYTGMLYRMHSFFCTACFGVDLLFEDPSVKGIPTLRFQAADLEANVVVVVFDSETVVRVCCSILDNPFR